MYHPEIRQEYRKKLGIGKSTFLLINVGRFSFEKNQVFAVQVLQQVKKIIPDTRLLFIGSGELEAEIKDSVHQMGLDGDVIFTGNVSNVYDYLQAADVFVFPSRFEGLGIVGVEAQTSGLPVIASDQVPAELNLTGNVKFLPLESPKEWADAVCSCRDMPRYQSLSVLREKGYDIRQTCQEIRQIYLGDS